MGMKVSVFKCPECGGSLNVNGSGFMKCEYCGHSIGVDDGTKRIKKEIVISGETKHERIIRDEARIKEAEVELRKINKEENFDKMLFNQWVIILIAVIIGLILL